MSTVDVQLTTTTLQDVPVHLCTPGPRNKTRPVDEEFRESIRTRGQRQPALLRPRPGHPEEFEVVDGGRRLEALVSLGMPFLRAEIREMSDAEAALEQAIVNKHRAPMSWQQEAELIAECQADGMPFEEIADKLGLDVRQVRRRAQLLRLSASWMNVVNTGVMSRWGMGHFEPLAFLSEDAQEELYVDFDSYRAREWTVRDVENWVAERSALLRSAPWDLEDAELLPAAGSCTACGERSSAQPDLFGETTGPKAKDRCLSAPCWARKLSAWLEVQYAKAVRKHGRVVKITKEFEQYGEELPPGKWEAARKTDEGAVAALVVRGEGLGKVEWVTLPGTRRRAASQEAPQVEEGADSPEEGPRRGPGRPVESEEVKRSKLEGRRWKFAIDMLMERIDLDRYERKFLTTEVVAMAVAFGVQSTANNGEPWRALENMRAWEKGALRAALLAQVKKAVVLRLLSAEDPVEEGRRAAALFRLDLEAMKQEADREIPEPAAWAKGPREQEAAQEGEPDVGDGWDNIATEEDA